MAAPKANTLDGFGHQMLHEFVFKLGVLKSEFLEPPSPSQFPTGICQKICSQKPNRIE